MEDLASPQVSAKPKHLVTYGAVAVLGLALGGYAIHEHSAAQELATQNAQQNATLTATQRQLSDLATRVNELATVNAAQASLAPPAQPPARQALASRTVKHRAKVDSRYKKLQAQLEAQNKAIEQNRKDLEGSLASTRTELSGSIAHTHDELVLLQKKGERSYAEFDLAKSKTFKREGPLELRLKKANNKHQYADLEMMVDDRNLSQKHVNLYQPVMFYTPDSPQPVEIVINEVSKDHIHGYVSASKYRKSELAAMAAPADGAATAQGDPAEQPVQRKKLPLPQPQP
jgi:flagellar motility protein MotE (MotC chaperone)